MPADFYFCTRKMTKLEMTNIREQMWEVGGWEAGLGLGGGVEGWSAGTKGGGPV